MTTWDLYCALHLGELVVLGPACHTAGCMDPVAAIVHWPSGPIRCCAACADGWRRVAGCLGTHVVIEPVVYQRGGLDDSAQRFALMEMS